MIYLEGGAWNVGWDRSNKAQGITAQMYVRGHPAPPQVLSWEGVMNTVEIVRTWDQFAPAYDRLERPLDTLIVARRRRALLRLARGEVLEVAAGTGRNLAAYPGDRTLRFTLTDLSAGMLAHARGRARADGRVRGLVQAEAHALPFPDASFDTVVETLSLCIVDDPAAGVRELARVCRPDGRILLLEHVASRSRLLRWLQDVWTPVQARRVGCHLNRDTLAAIKAAGVQIRSVDTHYQGVLLTVVAQP